MGWVRCTFRNCSVKSDKKTHLFHFPVFDKIRCHQWLVNARRLDLLNLTVSQLKNRCICQHHFEDRYFMNPMKEKLVKYAVPTLYGPYCNINEDQGESENETPYNISLDLIDNEQAAISDATYSTKYGNFLTNCDIMDIDQNFSKNTQPKRVLPKKRTFYPKKQLSDRVSSDIKKVLNPKFSKENDGPLYLEIDIKPMNSENPQITKEKPSVQNKSVYVKTEDLGLIEQKPLFFDENHEQLAPVSIETPLKKQQFFEQTLSELKLPLHSAAAATSTPEAPIYVDNLSNKKIANSSRVQILSVKTIRPGGKLHMDLEVSTIEKPNEKNEPESELDKTVTVTHSCENDPECLEKVEQTKDLDANASIDINKSRSLLLQNQTPTKRKMAESEEIITPKLKSLRSSEEAAKIQEKRKFNMRLGDIIKNSLNQLSTENFKESLEIFKANEKSKNIVTENVSQKTNEKSEVSGGNQFVISYLEARMKRMEDLLLNRIDNNTQKINELKSTLCSSKTNDEDQPSAALAKRAQGKKADMDHRKNLYNEISQFLKPETRSMIYEELFLDKTTESVPRFSKRGTAKRKT